MLCLTRARGGVLYAPTLSPAFARPFPLVGTCRPLTLLEGPAARSWQRSPCYLLVTRPKLRGCKLVAVYGLRWSCVMYLCFQNLNSMSCRSSLSSETGPLASQRFLGQCSFLENYPGDQLSLDAGLHREPIVPILANWKLFA